MIIITNHTNYVKVDSTSLATIGADLTHKILYIMKDQTLFIGLSVDESYVEVQISEGQSFKLDMNGVNGAPATVEKVVPLNNAQLAEELAKLKNL